MTACAWSSSSVRAPKSAGCSPNVRQQLPGLGQCAGGAGAGRTPRPEANTTRDRDGLLGLADYLLGEVEELVVALAGVCLGRRRGKRRNRERGVRIFEGAVEGFVCGGCGGVEFPANVEDVFGGAADVVDEKVGAVEVVFGLGGLLDRGPEQVVPQRRQPTRQLTGGFGVVGGLGGLGRG